MFDAFKQLVHKKKLEENPQYDGSNPKNENQVIKDLENMNVIKTPAKKSTAEQKADLLKKGIKLGVPPKEMEGMNLREMKERVQRRETMIQTRLSDFVEEVREEVPSAAPRAETEPLLPANKALMEEQRAREEEMEKLADDSYEMRRKRNMAAVDFSKPELKPQATEDKPSEAKTKLDIAIKEFGLEVGDVELEAGNLTEEIKREVTKARKKASYVSTPDEYWKTLDSNSLDALDELHKRGMRLNDLQERLVQAGVAYGLKEADLRAIADKVKLRNAVYSAADEIIDRAMIELPLEERRTVRESNTPIVRLKEMLDRKHSAASVAIEAPPPVPDQPEPIRAAEQETPAATLGGNGNSGQTNGSNGKYKIKHGYYSTSDEEAEAYGLSHIEAEIYQRQIDEARAARKQDKYERRKAKNAERQNGLERRSPQPKVASGINRVKVETIGLNAGLTREQMRGMSDAELVRAARAGWEQRVSKMYSETLQAGETLSDETATQIQDVEQALVEAETTPVIMTQTAEQTLEQAPQIEVDDEPVPLTDTGKAVEEEPPTERTAENPGRPPEITPAPPEAVSTPGSQTIKIEGRVIDVSEVVRNLGMRQAEQQMTELMNKSHFYNRWWLRMNEKAQLNARYREAVEGISENKNLLTLIEARMIGKSKVRPGEMDAQYRYLDEILLAYEKDIASEDEKGQLLVNPEVNARLGDLFYRHAKGEFESRKQFDEAVNAGLMPIFEAYAKEHPEMFTSAAGRQGKAEGLMFAQNFYQLAESYKDRIAEVVREHGGENEESVRNYLNGLMNIDIQLGLKQKELYNSQPEGKMGMLERLTDKLQAMPFGLGKVLANPVLFGSVGSMFGQTAARAALRGAALTGTALFFAPTTAALMAGGIAGGAFMWYRRGRDLKYDRGMDARRLALGELSGGKRTDKIREFAYEMKSASELTGLLNDFAGKDSLTDEERGRVAEIMARLGLEKKLNVDLVSVSEQAGREGMRITEMNPLLLSLKQVKEKFGLTEDAMRDLVGQKELALVDAINTQDKEFESFRQKEAAKAAVIGGAMGIAGGLLAQWGVDQLRGKGLPGVDANKHGSAIEGFYHWLRGESPYEYAAGPLVPTRLPGTEGTLNLPAGYSILDQSHGNIRAFGIKDPDGRVLAGNLGINSNGQLAGETVQELQGRGFVVEDFAKKIRGDIEIGERVTEGAAAPSVEEIQQWMPGLSEHTRVDWHDEAGPRYSNFFHKLIEFEGKQQMLYLEKDASGMVSINAEKVAMNLLQNARKAFAEYGTNPDGSVDTKLQHLMQQLESWSKSGELGKHLQAAVIPTAEANNEGLSLLKEGALPDGRLPLPKETWDFFKSNTDLYDGHLPFKYLEFRIDGHVLATAQGHDLFTGGATGIPGTRTPFANPSEIFVHNVNIRPPLNPDVPIPTPFFPRKHLEKTPLVPPPQPPYAGYGYSTPEQIQQRMEREQIEPVAPEKTRDVTRERDRIKEYLDTQEKQYLAELERLNRTVAPMNEKTRVAINVPAYNEEPNIERLLSQYTKQIDAEGKPLDPALYEVNIILNRPEGASSDRSAEIINEYKQLHPEFQINVLDVQFPKDKAGVGLARKYVTDLTLLRSIGRARQDGALYIQSEDADLLEVDPRVVAGVMEKFDKHPELDGLRGQQDRHPGIMMENDMLFLNRRAEDFWEVLMRDKKFRPEGVPDNFVWNRVVTGGWNTAYTAEVYAQIHGYNPLKVGEDMDIGQRISMLRGRKEGGKIVPDVRTVATVATRTHSSPRRFIDALARGIDPYSDFENESLKFQTTEQLMDKIKPYSRLDGTNTNQLERLLEGKYRYMIRDFVKDPQDADKFFGRLMHHLGFRKEDWSLQNGDLKISSIANVRKALSDYRKNPLYLKKLKIARKEGVRPAAEAQLRRPETPEEEQAQDLPLNAEATVPTPINEVAGEAELRPNRVTETSPVDSDNEEIAPERQAIREQRAELYRNRGEYIKQRFDRLDSSFKVEDRLPTVETSVFVSDIEHASDFGKAVKQYVDTVLNARFRTMESKAGSKAARYFGAYMDALGFKRDDWELDGKTVSVKSIENVKTAINSYRVNPELLESRTAAFEPEETVETERQPKKPVIESLNKRNLRAVRERFNVLKKVADSYSSIRQKKDLKAMAEAETVLSGIYQGLPEGGDRKADFLRAIQPTGIKENQLEVDASGNVKLSESVNQRQLLRKLKPNMLKKALEAARKSWEGRKKELGL